MTPSPLLLAFALGIAILSPALAEDEPEFEPEKSAFRCVAQSVVANEKVRPRMADADCSYNQKLYLCEIAAASKEDILRIADVLESCLDSAGFALKKEMNKGTEKQEKEYELDGEEASIWIAGPKIVEGNWSLEIEALGAI